MPKRNQAKPARSYVGFWRRTAAALVDAGLIIVVAAPIMTAVYGRSLIDSTLPLSWTAHGLSLLIPALLVLVFWVVRQATPGKLLIQAEIVDAESGLSPTPRQWVRRYLGYFVSIFALGLGFLWVAVDTRKQAWHDKLAGTVVVDLASVETTFRSAA